MIASLPLKGALAVVGLVLVGLAGYGAGIYLGFFAVPFVSTPPEHSARYYPDDVIAYSWMTLNPGGGQRRHMTEMASRMRDISDVREWEEELKDALDDALGIEFEDIAAWIGTEMSMAVLDFDIDDGTVEMAATVAVRDREAAEGFLEQVLDRLEDDGGFEFESDEYGGFETWVDEADRGAYALSLALSDDLLVVASAEHTLKIVLDRVNGEQTRTLASTESFQEARAALSKQRFVSAYLDYGNLLDVVEDAAGLGPADLELAGNDGGCADLLGPTPQWAGMSAGALERGIRAETVIPLPDSSWPEVPELIDPAELLPENALGFVAVSFNPAIDEWRGVLGKCAIADLLGEDAWGLVLESISPRDQVDWFEQVDRMGLGVSPESHPVPVDRDTTLGHALDIGLWAGSRLAGFDLQADLFDHLQGTAISGILHVSGDLAEAPLDAVGMLSYRAGSADALDEALGRAVSLLESEFDLDFDPANVGAERRARLLDLPDMNDIGYAPGYVLNDGFITFGTTESAIEAIVSRQEGRGDALSSKDAYRRAIGELPGNREMIGYVNLQSIVSLAYDIDQGDLDRQMLDTLEETLEATAMAITSDGGVSRVALILTVFPEG